MSEAFIELCELLRQAGAKLTLYGRPVTEHQVIEYAAQRVNIKIRSAMANGEESKWTASDELDGIKLGTAEEERHRAKLWMDTAAQHARNEEYWRKRSHKAEHLIHSTLKAASEAGYDIEGLARSLGDD